jgi:hypothetical protein
VNGSSKGLGVGDTTPYTAVDVVSSGNGYLKHSDGTEEALGWHELHYKAAPNNTQPVTNYMREHFP